MGERHNGMRRRSPCGAVVHAVYIAAPQYTAAPVKNMAQSEHFYAIPIKNKACIIIFKTLEKNEQFPFWFIKIHSSTNKYLNKYL